MQHTNGFLIRSACPSDCNAVVALEERVWKRLGVKPITPRLFREWARAHQEGLLLAFEGKELRGYTYVEYVHFNPHSLAAPAWDELVRTQHTRAHHTPSGNAVFGASVAADPPGKGAGQALLERVISLSIAQRKEYLITFSRMPGFSSYMALAREHGAREEEATLARSYGVLSMRLLGSEAIGPARGFHVPSHLPSVDMKDPVMGLFATALGMSFFDVVPTVDSDPQSSNLAALMVRSFSYS